MMSIASARELFAVSIAVLLVALLVNLFARSHRRELRRAVILYLVYLLGVVFETVAGQVSGEGARWIGILTDIVMGLALVHLAAIVVFDLVFTAVAIRVPTVVLDVLIGVAYCVVTGTVLAQNGVDITSFVAVSTVAAAVLSLSLQSTLGNVIGGLALQFDGSVEPGQWIGLESGKQGKVREIRWRTTLLETRDGDTLIVPNATMLASTLLVLGRRNAGIGPHRMWVQFNIDFRYPPTQVIEVVEAALRGQLIENVVADPLPDCVCIDFARDGRDSFALYAVRYWLADPASDDPTSSRVRERVFAALRRADIPFAAPTLRSVMSDDTDAKRFEQRRIACRFAVDRVELFKSLTDEERNEIAERLVPAWFAPGEVMTRQGAVAHWLYVLVSGTAEIRVTGESGKERVVAAIEGPGFFGEMGLMTGEPRQASVVAITACDCYRLDKATVEKIIKHRPELANELSSVLALRRIRLGLAQKRPSLHPETADAETREILRRVKSFFGL